MSVSTSICGLHLFSCQLLLLAAVVAFKSSPNLFLRFSVSAFLCLRLRVRFDGCLPSVSKCHIHIHILRLTFHFNELIITERRRLCSVMRTRTVAIAIIISISFLLFLIIIIIISRAPLNQNGYNSNMTV